MSATRKCRTITQKKAEEIAHTMQSFRGSISEEKSQFYLDV
jgi:hypothetical protein